MSLQKIVTKISRGLIFLAIVATVSHYLIETEPYIVLIVIQDFPEKESSYHNLDSFAGIMFLEKTFILIIAFFGNKLWQNHQAIFRVIKTLFKASFSAQKDPTNLPTNQQTKNGIKSSNIQGLENMQFQYNKNVEKQQQSTSRLSILTQVWIGLFSFIAIQYLSEVQQKMDIPYMIQKKNVNILWIFVLVHCFAWANKFQWKTHCVMRISIQDNNIIFEVIKSFICLYYLVGWRVSLLLRSGMDQYYDKTMCPYFCRDKNVVDSQAIQIFQHTIIADYLMFLGLFWLRKINPKINPFGILIGMTKFTAVFFALYGLYIGDFIPTLKVILNVPSILAPLANLFSMHLVVYFLYSVLIVYYTPLMFFAVFLTRGFFDNFYERMQEENDKEKKEILWNMFVVILILFFEILVRKDDEPKEQNKNIKIPNDQADLSQKEFPEAEMEESQSFRKL